MGVSKSRRPIIAPGYLDFQPPDSLAGSSSTIPDEYVFVSEKGDLPTPAGGVITLAGASTYLFTQEVDLTGDRLVAGENTVILGTSSENARIKSTGLGATALISSAFTLPMRFITIEADIALNLSDGGSEPALDWTGVNFTDCAVIGTIENYDNIIMTDCAFLNSANLTFDGTVDTIAFSGCLLVGIAGQTTIDLPATLTITRRFRIIYSAVVTPAGGTAIDMDVGCTCPDEAYILDTINFSGSGTPLAGVTVADERALFFFNVGIDNSFAGISYTMNGNSTVTTISMVDTPTKVLGTTVEGLGQKFTHTNNRATYTGSKDRNFIVRAVLTFEGTVNNEIAFYVYKNGVQVSESVSVTTLAGTNRKISMSIQGGVLLSDNDFIEIFVENETGSADITIVDMNVIVDLLL